MLETPSVPKRVLETAHTPYTPQSTDVQEKKNTSVLPHALHGSLRSLSSEKVEERLFFGFGFKGSTGTSIVEGA